MLTKFGPALGRPKSYESVAVLPRPRTIKTHLSHDMLPKQVKEKGAKVNKNHLAILVTLVPGTRYQCIEVHSNGTC